MAALLSGKVRSLALAGLLGDMWAQMAQWKFSACLQVQVLADSSARPFHAQQFYVEKMRDSRGPVS